MRVSIILPCRNEEGYIEACLHSILATDYPHELLEILVVDGRSDDGTRTTVERCRAKVPFIHVIDNPERIVPTALNRAIRRATGDVIVRMDAHVVYPPDYVPRLVEALVESGADNVGGRLVTLPPSQDLIPRAIAQALSHPFGVGNSHFRIGTEEPRWVDTVPFGCFRRDAFTRFGLFDEDLVRNQDDEFNHRVISRGGRILLVPGVVSFYYARTSLKQVARMYYQYGYFKPLVARKIGRILTLRQLIPTVFVLGLLSTALLALLWNPGVWVLAGLLGAYALALVSATLPAATTGGVRGAIALAAAFATMHVSYGFGFLRGFRWLLPRRRRPAESIPLSR
jgi:glycosyltransferase involved in cell wall biosynthesis